MPDGFAREPSGRAERIECQICSRGLIPVFFRAGQGPFRSIGSARLVRVFACRGRVSC
nr:hypothetical protein DO63_5865 [Burkholderia pseudomallei]